MTYADSGFLVSLYLKESTSAVARRIVTSLQEPVSISWLTLLEFENALLRAVFTRRITTQDAATAKAQFLANLSSGIYREELVDCRAISIEASRLAAQFTPALGTRTLDLLHVAAASMLNCTTFLSFDERQRQAAAALGMSVQP